MDLTAIGMCMENDLPILVFNFKKEGNIERAVLGEPIGTWISGAPAPRPAEPRRLRQEPFARPPPSPSLGRFSAAEDFAVGAALIRWSVRPVKAIG